MTLLWIVLGAIALTVLLSYLAYRKTFYQNRKKPEDIYELPPKTPEAVVTRTRAMIRDLDAVEYEPVEIRSEDGLRLFARYYHVADGAPLHIEMHGYRSYAMRDFCGINTLACAEGHNTLVVDQRAHGRSEGHTISFGIKEKRDCLLWVEYACRRFGKNTPIFLSGVSMGAATVLMATELPLPENVVGVLADCPYSSPRAIIWRVAAKMGFPVALAYPFVVLGAFLFGGITGMSGEGAIRAVKRSTVPILILHGEDDCFVPCDMSREIAKVSPLVQLETFPAADHAMSYMTDYERYKQVSHTFVKDCLQRFQKQ